MIRPRYGHIVFHLVVETLFVGLRLGLKGSPGGGIELAPRLAQEFHDLSVLGVGELLGDGPAVGVAEEHVCRLGSLGAVGVEGHCLAEGCGLLLGNFRGLLFHLDCVESWGGEPVREPLAQRPFVDLARSGRAVHPEAVHDELDQG